STATDSTDMCSFFLRQVTSADPVRFATIFASFLSPAFASLLSSERVRELERGSDLEGAKPTADSRATQPSPGASSRRAGGEAAATRTENAETDTFSDGFLPAWFLFFCLFVFASVATVKWGRGLASLSHGLLDFLSQSYTARIEPLVVLLRELSFLASSARLLNAFPLSLPPLGGTSSSFTSSSSSSSLSFPSSPTSFVAARDASRRPARLAEDAGQAACECQGQTPCEIQDSASASPAKAKEEPRGEAAAEEIEEEKTLGRKHDGESRAFPGKGNSENGSARNATVCPLWRRFSFEVFVAVVEEIMQEPRRSVCACLALLSRFTAAGRSSSWRECPQKPTKETEKRLQERSNSQAESDGDTKKAEEAFVQHALHVVWSTGEAVIAALNAEDAGGCKAQVAFVLDCLRAGESRS
ncbi:putative transmembrane protein, partial [Toxoplasma gondii p89]